MKPETARQHNAPQVGFYELLRDEPGEDIIRTMFEACGHKIKFVDFTPKKKARKKLAKTKNKK
jgi:hypothetical protein